VAVDAGYQHVNGGCADCVRVVRGRGTDNLRFNAGRFSIMHRGSETAEQVYFSKFADGASNIFQTLSCAGSHYTRKSSFVQVHLAIEGVDQTTTLRVVRQASSADLGHCGNVGSREF